MASPRLDREQARSYRCVKASILLQGRDGITAFLQAYRDALIASKLAPTDV